MSVQEARRLTTGALSKRQALATEVPRGRPTGEWGMLLFITTEATFFACLVASYFYLRFVRGGPWPPGGIEVPKLMKPGIMTVLLFTSSGTMLWADRAIRHGKQRQLIGGLLTTLLLGVLFLTVQSTEYHEKLAKFTPRTNVYGSVFYTITGFHSAHVVTGLIMIIVITVAAARGKFTDHRQERVRMVGLYWHFVDTVWGVIFLSLYLSPHLGA